MYTEEYEHKGFPFRDFLLKLILIIIFVFLLVWLLPKFISPKIVNNNTSSKNVDLSPLTSQIFADNLEKMKDAAISYYTDERLPKEVGESDTLTLSDMIGKKLVVALIDKNNKACDVEKSYVKITKMDDEYLLKVNLKSSHKEDYILVHLGCYTYCDSYICEKNETNVAIKASKPQATVVINGSNNSSGSGSSNDNTNEPSSPSAKPSDSPVAPPSEEPGYLYEYTKTTGASFSSWTRWSSWDRTSCATQAVNCSDSSPSCLKKVQLYNRKEKIGTYNKKYTKTRSQLYQTGSYQEKSCSKYNYVIVNSITYATTTTTTYTTVNTITANTAHTVGGWSYNGRASYSNPPRDTETTSYKFVGADYSYCSDTCTTLPNYYYDSYTYTGGMTSVSNTTTPGNTTSSSNSSSSSSSSSSVTASCGEIVTKTVPIYGSINISEVATRQEPLYGTVCYQSSKTRTLKNDGKTTVKWSVYNDTTLLNDGWTYTGAKKKK